jgi:phage major head subunit gpT-like protein
MLVKTDIPKLLLAGMKKEFFKVYDEEVSSEYERVATIIRSTKSQETYPWLGAVAKIQEWKDERVPKELLEHNFSVTNRDWEGTIEIDRNAIDDEQYGQITIRVRQLAQEAKLFIGELVFQLLGEGDTSTGKAGTNFAGLDITCYDGNPFFYATHSEGSSGSQSNKGTAAISFTGLQAAITAMKGIKDDAGKYLNVNPDLLVVNQSDEFACREFLNSTFYPAVTAQANPQKLATNVLKGALDLYVTPYVESGTWVVLDTKNTIKPLIVQLRKDPQFTTLLTGPDAYLRKKLFFGVDFRMEAAFGMWQYAYGSNSGW